MRDGSEHQTGEEQGDRVGELEALGEDASDRARREGENEGQDGRELGMGHIALQALRVGSKMVCNSGALFA